MGGSVGLIIYRDRERIEVGACARICAQVAGAVYLTQRAGRGWGVGNPNLGRFVLGLIDADFCFFLTLHVDFVVTKYLFSRFIMFRDLQYSRLCI